jgi:predicted Zn-dependent peptidase
MINKEYIDDICNVFNEDEDKYTNTFDYNSFESLYKNNQIGGNTFKIKKTEISHYILPNKLKVVLLPLDNSTTITTGIFINTGSRHETKSYGIAHFLEHMTFKGTTNRTEEDLMIELDSIGAQYNAYTSYEYTIYYIAGNPNDIDSITNIIVDLHYNPTYPDNEISKERKVVLEELDMNLDNNARVLHNKMYESIYNNIDDTLKRPIIGYRETVEKLTRKDIIDYREKNYRTDNSFLMCCGNFNKNKYLELLCKIFKINIKDIKEIEYNPVDMDDKLILRKKDNSPHLIKYEKDINQSIIKFLFNCTDIYSRWNPTTLLLTDILSNGFSSRLFNLLRNKNGITYYNNCNLVNYSDDGHFVITVGVDPNEVDKTIKLIIGELEGLQNQLNKIEEKELNRAKKQNETALLFDFKDSYDYFMFYGMRIMYKQPTYSLSRLYNQLEKVKVDNINKLCNKLLDKNNMYIGIIGKNINVKIDDYID